MNDFEIKRAVELEVDRLFTLIVSKHLGSFPRPNIGYFDNRRAAGTANYATWAVSFNIVLLRENFDRMIGETVAHEVAHLVHRHGIKLDIFPAREGARRRPHGHCWSFIMRSWLGVDPERTHNLDVTNVKSRKQRRWAATCDCKTYHVTTIRRNKMLRGTKYRCGLCHGTLTLETKEMTA